MYPYSFNHTPTGARKNLAYLLLGHGPGFLAWRFLWVDPVFEYGRPDFFWGHHFGPHEFFVHQIVVHRLGHDFGDVCEPELDEGVAFEPSRLFASTQSDVGHFAELREKLEHLVLVEAVGHVAQVDHTPFPRSGFRPGDDDFSLNPTILAVFHTDKVLGHFFEHYKT